MTIEAIKEALDALEDLLYHDEEPDQRLGRAVYVLQEAVKEAEKQEPVAWMYVNTDGECEQIEYGLCDFDDPSIQLLYTAPRQWVGLTDEEIAAVMHRSVEGERMLPHQFARAIEQLVRNKNEQK